MSEAKSSGSKTTVRLDQLFLSMTNPRHEAVDGEPEAIERLCRTEDIEILAHDIALHGTNPAERLILFPVEETEKLGEDTSYYVVEGIPRLPDDPKFLGADDVEVVVDGVADGSPA